MYRSLPNLFGSETRVIRIGKDVPMIEGEYPDADDPLGPKPKWDKSTYHVGCGPTRDILRVSYGHDAAVVAIKRGRFYIAAARSVCLDWVGAVPQRSRHRDCAAGLLDDVRKNLTAVGAEQNLGLISAPRTMEAGLRHGAGVVDTDEEPRIASVPCAGDPSCSSSKRS